MTLAVTAFHAFIGPIIGFALLGVAATATYLLRHFREHALPTIRNLHAISAAAAHHMDLIDCLPNPFTHDSSGALAVTALDLVCTYLNSRENLRLSHLASVNAEDSSTDVTYLLRRIEGDHRRLRGLVMMALFDVLIAKRMLGWYPMHADALFWLYVEEQELMAHLAEYCSRPGQLLILARL